MAKNMTYAGTGVEYDPMDAFKRKAQEAARKTAGNISRFGFSEVEMSRGESVYLVETPDCYLAQVIEGLGTKNLVADEMYRLTGRLFYNQIAQDAVAMIVNDGITLGALPISTAMYFAVGNSNWFLDEKRYENFIDGWRNACNLAGCVWGPGETPALKGVNMPEAADIAGSMFGIIKPKERLIDPKNIQPGSVMVGLNSLGLQANGYTMARFIGERKDSLLRRTGHLFFPRQFSLNALPNGYLTKLEDGRTYGETLLDPSLIYVPVIEKCLDRGVKIHGAENITGHGLRKLMRPKQLLTYVIDKLPDRLPIFNFVQKRGPVSNKEMCGTFNEGVGYMIFTPKDDADKVIAISASLGYGAFIAGYVENGPKRVIIRPRGIEFLGSDLNIR